MKLYPRIGSLLSASATAIVGLFAHDIGKNGGKAPAIDDRGKLAERLEGRIRPFPLCIA